MDNQEKVLLEKAEKNMLKKAKVLMKTAMKTADSCMQHVDESQELLKQQLKMSKESLLKQYSAKVVRICIFICYFICS